MAIPIDYGQKAYKQKIEMLLKYLSEKQLEALLIIIESMIETNP